MVELTEHQDVEDVRGLVQLCDRLTGAGARIALDDAGSGYSGLQQMARVRPHLVKLDRALVEDADRDQVKLALASCSVSSPDGRRARSSWRPPAMRRPRTA